MSTSWFFPRRGDGPARKGFRCGTHRLIAPEETVARVSPFLPGMGITRVANVTGLDSIGIPVVMVCRPNSRSMAVAQGKGLDLAAAKASALMESIEGYHAQCITLPLKLGSYEELRTSHRLVDIARLPRTFDSRFQAHAPQLWIEGHDLLQDEPTWVPYELVHLSYTVGWRVGSLGFAASSNGLASGNHLLEAISHGICELVERDASTLWSLAGAEELRQTRIDPDTVTDPGCRTVLEKYACAGVSVGVWETTTDVGISAFRCLISDGTEDPWRRLYSAAGMGCHPERSIALLRALTEAAQSRLTAISGSRDDMFRNRFEHCRNPETLRGDRAILNGAGPMRHFHGGPNWDGETFDDDVTWELDRLRSVGIEQVVAVDLTKPELDLPVARVVIPGLESVLIDGYLPGGRARALLKERA